MKLKFRKSLALGLSLVLVIHGCSLWTMDSVYASTPAGNYIVITENGEAAQKIIENHDVISDMGDALSVNLSAKEAAQLESDQNVLCVEKDFTIERAIDAGENIVKPSVEKWNLKAINAENATTNSTVKVWNKDNDALQRAFVMGMAMHVATDTFAHSAFAQMQSGSYSWRRITHTNNAADDPTHHPKRVQMAYAAEKNVVSRYNGNRENYHTCNDFYDTASGAYDNLTFRITKMRTFAEVAGYTTESVLSKFGKLQQTY